MFTNCVIVAITKILVSSSTHLELEKDKKLSKSNTLKAINENKLFCDKENLLSSHFKIIRGLAPSYLNA